MEKPGKDHRTTVQAVERALGLLTLLGSSHRPMTVTELADASGLKLTTAHRLLKTMLAKGYVEKDEVSRYRLGPQVLALSQAARGNLDIRRTARPFMEKLARETGETVNLALLDRSEVIYIDQIESSKMVIVKMFARTGNRGPAHCTGSGKVLLAYLSEEEREKILASMRFEKFTNETIDNVDKLRMELERVRRDGYSLDLGERDEGVRCVAAPIFNSRGEVEAAISVAGPSHRLTNFYINHELIRKVKQAAFGVSASLSSQPVPRHEAQSV